MSVGDAKTLSAWRALAQAAQHVSEGRDCGDAEQRRERLEAAAMSAKVALGLLAEVEPATVDAAAPFRLSPKAAAHWRGLQALRRREANGEPDDVLDVERERLAAQWAEMSEEDRARIEGAMR